MPFSSLFPRNMHQLHVPTMTVGITIFFLLFLLLPGLVHAQEFTAPVVKIVDRNNVNLGSNQLAISQTDVSIGNGDLSLSHSISSWGLEMAKYNDSFWGGAGKTQWREHSLAPWIDVLTVRLANDTVNFTILSDTTYTAFIDPRYLLVLEGNTYIFTTPDGTEMRFVKTNNIAHGPATLKEITYPNGFKVTVSYLDAWRIGSVTTNNGLQLLYVYEGTSATLRQIVALNNATTVCSPGATCNLTNWPTSRYALPAPALRTGNFVFTLTDAQNRTTEYHHTVYQDAQGPEVRLTKVKKAGDTQPSITYGYKTDYDYIDYGIGLLGFVIKPASIMRLMSATQGSTVWTYSMYASEAYAHTEAQGVGLTASIVQMILPKGVPVEIQAQDAIYYKSATWANTLDSIAYAEGGSSTFTYDARLNLTQQKDDGVVVATASYTGCTASTRKYCNKPIWTRDGRNLTTHYQYHPESGQLATVTYPAVNGVTAQTRYDYQPYYAWYKNATGSIVQAPSPIYLLARESTCVTGNASGDGCANPQDELVTRYDYGQGSSSQPNNLWLRGVEKVSATGTLRTCYQYDVYGNPIAETSPQALLNSCPH